MFYFGRNGIGDVGRYVRRSYAPLPERLESLVQHLEAIPATLRQIDANLEPELPSAQLAVALDEVRRATRRSTSATCRPSLARNWVPSIGAAWTGPSSTPPRR